MPCPSFCKHGDLPPSETPRKSLACYAITWVNGHGMAYVFALRISFRRRRYYACIRIDARHIVRWSNLWLQHEQHPELSNYNGCGTKCPINPQEKNRVPFTAHEIVMWNLRICKSNILPRISTKRDFLVTAVTTDRVRNCSVSIGVSQRLIYFVAFLCRKLDPSGLSHFSSNDACFEGVSQSAYKQRLAPPTSASLWIL